MCAIIGLYKTDDTPIAAETLAAMAAPLAHRAPSGSGEYISNRIGLYHGRLAIHDLSEQGKQPFDTPSGIVAITNGEIYNFNGLKHYLQTQNTQCHWQSTSDCEVIPYLYQIYGTDFTRYLRGMYAIALWDSRKDQLILTRGPFGMKQLYYCELDDGFYFASELRALQAEILKQRKPTLDPDARLELLQYHFSLDNQTIFSDIKRVQPGELLIVEHGKIRSNQFYPSKLGFQPQKINTQSESALLAAYENTIDESIKLHLSADVPVGLFLSGGIDSTTLLSFIKRHHTKPLHTYSLGFDSDTTHNESTTAKTLAAHFNTIHHNITLTEAEFWDLLPQAILATDDPTADYAIVPTFKLAQAAKENVTVVLSGEGGDEVFAGYGRYRHYLKPPWRGGKGMYTKGDMSVMKILQTDIAHSRRAFYAIEKTCKVEQYSKLYTAQTMDIRTWLPNDLLIKLDRILMWHGLEGRCPLLDKKVIQFANTLPETMKVRRKMGKWIMRQWLSQNVSGYDAFTPKKGFTVPIQAWLENKRDTLGPLLMTLPCLTDICDAKGLQKLLKKPFTRKTAKAAWSLLYYALWYQIHIEKRQASANIETILR